MAKGGAKILVCGRFHAEAFNWLKSQADVKHSSDSGPTPEDLAWAEGLLIRSKTAVNKDLLDQAPNLKVVVTATSGFDHIRLSDLENSAVKVMYTPDANAQSAAELTWALLLNCSRHIQEAHGQIKAGHWDRSRLQGRELAGKCHGIIGLGRIGAKVSKFAQAFSMECIAFDPYIEDEDFDRLGVERVGLDELLKRVDSFSIHVPYSKETHNMLHRVYLENLQPGTILVNTSRGQIIREEEIIHALDQGWLSRVALDVFDKEPLPRTSPLLSRKEILMSPHIGATSQEALFKSSQEAAEKALRFLEDGSSSETLPPKALWFQTPLGKDSTKKLYKN